jgi:hypothetical protein
MRAVAFSDPIMMDGVSSHNPYGRPRLQRGHGKLPFNASRHDQAKNASSGCVVYVFHSFLVSW